MNSRRVAIGASAGRGRHTRTIEEASVFLPGDEDGYAAANIGGVLHELTERRGGRWELSWRPDRDDHPGDVSITLWPTRFRQAELTTGQAEFEQPRR